MKENIKKLLADKTVSNYKISKETGIAQATLSDYSTGKSKIGNMKLDHALKLNDYYLKYKEEIKMKNIIEVIRKKYKVDGEDERYATLFESKKAIKDDEIDLDIFEETFDVSVDKLKFPVITFDNANAVDGWIFEADTDEEIILERAVEYFTEK